MYYPLMIDIGDKLIAVIGGGKVALRKVKKLLEFQGKVRVVSPQLLDEFKELKNRFCGKLEIIEDKFKEDYIKDAFLVIGATDRAEINKDISNYCRKNNILCNIVDDIEFSDFIVPSSIKRGSLVISISTMGKSPSLAAKIKKDLEKAYSEEYEEYVDLLGEARRLILKNYNDDVEKREMLKDIINMPIEELKRFIENESRKGHNV
ncbi:MULTISPECIES: precorrin-2 dehydrogenase/sirohydrochlorin ferrochelatase family protein [Clostridium]|uniref:precorrin-2 dehydrogenase n=2 Tax=Clostridium TaxID=1485 RepID=A0A151AKI6_9CLOT|nr:MULTISPECIES: bifunctional precorrin-2 dehydrogenase/sirohydrochlorin ferrochelatase [Clostridium]KYH28144.1 precorrin-2 dehydrogenase [Clostridium colicanis DSM 13634]MBE6043090.1 bifunctional precorrin-2 dehydrogenase/sirohydrochlorin ferrochelatase [Clostridium thermopalmarium]PRR72688.1 Precorrin-2 dehydrogenase [Clostridium thermopalmarium DSM 5974]PVZ20898.1 precorrin-2 dehydrogenase/sirohydrochlorin ferrochelatase [Clostridium thermopalmarium DSM 5974]